MTFVLVIGVTNAILGGAGVALRDWQLRSRFDARLAERADRLAQWAQPRLRAGEDPAAILNDPARPYADERLYASLVGPAGEGHTANLRGMDLAMLWRGGGGSAGGAEVTLSGDGVGRMRGRPERVRVVARQVPVEGERYWMVVGEDLAEVDASLAFLRTLLWIALPTALGVAGLAGWIVINRALRALRVVSTTASHITPGRLDERIRVTSTDSEINRLVTELNHMLDRLSASFKAQQRFITNASHALQTPVAALLSQAQVLRSADTSDADCRRFVASVEEEMRQLTRMLRSMLSLIRMESGELERAQRVLSLNDVLVSAVEDLRAAAAAKGLQVRLTLPEPEQTAVEPEVVGDAGLLQTMTENLVRNAIQFSPRGGPVEVVLELDADQAVVTVSDRGPALSSAALRSIFDREADSGGPERNRRGDGFALSMGKAIAELHDGTLGVRNRPDGGVAFFVWLPLAEQEE